ncbi:sugar ABC transporter ATP-binding protein [Actinomadura sp. WMMA1423]|uniref:sugar ABC transporter ATP-binding protein n=1 Tax=Actinomadura sp. WMMA1423 TaxID=2591108 RepID=UPI001F10AEC9|nr:sugar ABC transporter ATP-binding protein [Actinomadura sp. WMMA1423]
MTAVEGVDLTVLRGEVHSLVGENGAGKSTLMKIIDGVQRPDAGSLHVDGEEVSFASVHDAERAGIAMIPQELELFDELTVAENLYVGRPRPRTRLGLIDRSVMRARARELFERLNADIDPEALVSGLRPAVRQMVAIARALLRDAQILIMDEPTASLTDQDAVRLFETISDLSGGGVTVIYISHRLEEIFEISDMISVLRDGHLMKTAPASTFSRRELIHLMVGRPLEQLYTRHRRPAGDPVLEVESLTRPGEFADIDLTVHAGEIVGLAGLIGAGRSEVARALFGADPVSAGTIRLRGRAVRPRSPRHAQELGIAYVPEERRADGLVLPFSISRNISFGSLEKFSRFGLVDRGAEDRLATRFREHLAIRTPSVGTAVGLLSGGNQQKVAVAKALAREPALLILDEPTRGVDVGAKAEIYRLIDDLAAEGKAILLISSELDEVLSMADRILVLREGRITAEFDHREATAELVGAAATGVPIGASAPRDEQRGARI